MLYYGKSDIGKKRGSNQDTFITESFCANVALYAVCDGMGGAKGGKEASELAVSAFYSGIKKALAPYVNDDRCDINGLDVAQIIIDSVYEANSAVYDKSKENAELNGMGTTLVAALVLDNFMYIVNVGDSRMYIYSENELHQVTHDHSYVQYLIDIGQITVEEAHNNPNRNIIMRAVGIEDEVEADLFKIDMNAYGAFTALLCSDGLSNYVSADDIKNIISAPVENDLSTLETKVNELISAANNNGGGDNITAILLQFSE